MCKGSLVLCWRLTVPLRAYLSGEATESSKKGIPSSIFIQLLTKGRSVMRDVCWAHPILPVLDPHSLFQVNQAKPATAGKAVTAYEVPLGWPVSLGFLVLPALLALRGTASRRLAGCRLGRELVRTWKGREWAAHVPPSASIDLLPAQTAEKQIRNGGETHAEKPCSRGFSKAF